MDPLVRSLHFGEVIHVYLLEVRKHLEDHGEYDLVRLVGFLKLVLAADEVRDEVSQVLPKSDDGEESRLNEHLMVEIRHLDLAVLLLRPHGNHYFLHELVLRLIAFDLLVFAVHQDRHISKDAHGVSLLALILVVELKLLSYHFFQLVLVEEDRAILHYGSYQFLLFPLVLVWVLLHFGFVQDDY